VISAVPNNVLLTTAAITNANTTAAYTYSGTTVTGVGTQFTNTFAPRLTVTIGGQTVDVIAIASNTSMITRVITNANTAAAYTLVANTSLSAFGNGTVQLGSQWATNANSDLASYGGVLTLGGSADNTISNYIRFSGGAAENIDIGSRYDGFVSFNDSGALRLGNNQQVQFEGHTSFNNFRALGYVRVYDNGAAIPSTFVIGTGAYGFPTVLFNSNIPISLMPSGGDVGIGITTPTATFQVAQGTAGFGSVSNGPGGTTVTGLSTQFLNTFKVGDTISIGGQTVAISAIASNTSMTTAAITNPNIAVPYFLTSTTGPGNVSNSAGGTTVTGVGTEFLNTFKVGDTITFNSGTAQTVAISAIASNTSMTTAVITAAHSNVAYTLVGGIRFSVLGNGNVGIGTTAPGGKLEVANGHYVSSQTTPPTPSVSGAGYSVGSMVAGSTDTKGGVTATVGAAVGTIVVTFQSPYPTAPICTTDPSTATAQADVGKMYSTTGTNALTLNFVATPTGGVETWNYICLQ
jgi:hypothetical protein